MVFTSTQSARATYFMIRAYSTRRLRPSSRTCPHVSTTVQKNREKDGTMINGSNELPVLVAGSDKISAVSRQLRAFRAVLDPPEVTKRLRACGTTYTVYITSHVRASR